MTTPAGYANCSYEITLTGLIRPAYVTFGINPIDTDPQTIGQQLLNAWTASGSFTTILDANCIMTAVRVSLGTDAGGGDLVSVTPTSVVGGNPQTSVPPNCAVLFHKATSRGGRRGRGRMYFPWCVGETSVDEAGVITAGIVTQMTNAATAWRLALAAGGNPLVLLHAPGKTAQGAPDPVSSMTADRLIATQRRRLGR